MRDFIDMYLKAEKDGDETGALTGKYNVILTVNSISLKHTVVIAIFQSKIIQSTTRARVFSRLLEQTVPSFYVLFC